MTHYNISYKGLTPQQAYDKSIQDIVAYLGVAKFNQVTKEFRAVYLGGCSYTHFANWVSLLGVQGFPVHAWYDWTFPIGDAPSHAWDWPADE